MTDPSTLQRALDAVVVVETGEAYCAGAGIVAAEATEADRAATGPYAAAYVAQFKRELIVTAYHCVAGGGRPHLRWRDGKTGVGRVIARSPDDDLALIEVVEKVGFEGDYPTLSLRTEAVAQGEEVWGLGHPFGLEAGGKMSGLLEWSVTHGVVSGVGGHLVQTDAALNPGNSGGPLIDGDGGLVGVVSRKLRADNLAFVSPTANVEALVGRVNAMRAAMECLPPYAMDRDGVAVLVVPEPCGNQSGPHPVGPRLGGTVDSGLVLSADETTWGGADLSLAVRDRLVVDGAIGLAPGQAWAAHGILDVTFRQRLGWGGLTGTAEIGPALTLDGSGAPTGAWASGVLDPAIVARIGFNQLTFGVWYHPLRPAAAVAPLGVTVSLAIPGEIAVF